MTEGKENLLSSFGECHRYAPKPLILERQTARDAQLVWPKTRAVDPGEPGVGAKGGHVDERGGVCG